MTPAMSRPSNSGIATCVAASSGAKPLSEASQAAREEVAHTACRTGTSSASSTDASHSCQLSPTPSPALATAWAAPEPPVASIHDQRVHAVAQELERRHAPLAIPAQRVAPDGQRVASRRLDLLAQPVDELRVAGQPVRAIEAHPDRRPSRIVAGPRLGQSHLATPGQIEAQVGHRPGRLKPVALH